MKLFFIFFATVFVFAQTASAITLPKTAKVLLALDQPAVVVQLPALDLNNATIDHDFLVKFKQTGTITVGTVVYDMDPTAMVNLKDDSKGLTLDNVTMFRYRLYSQEMKSVVGDLVVDLKTGNVSLNKSSFKGIVTAWY